jgi:large subunit ribosomal protein L2
MGIKKLTPTSAARRYQTYLTRDELTVGAVPEKSLLEPKKRISGRNNDGRITVRRRGGGHKRFYRVVDFKRDKEGVPGRVHADRIRSESFGAHRVDYLSRR